MSRKERAEVWVLARACGLVDELVGDGVGYVVYQVRHGGGIEIRRRILSFFPIRQENKQTTTALARRFPPVYSFTRLS